MRYWQLIHSSCPIVNILMRLRFPPSHCLFPALQRCNHIRLRVSRKSPPTSADVGRFRAHTYLCPCSSKYLHVDVRLSNGRAASCTIFLSLASRPAARRAGAQSSFWRQMGKPSSKQNDMDCRRCSKILGQPHRLVASQACHSACLRPLCVPT